MARYEISYKSVHEFWTRMVLDNTCQLPLSGPIPVSKQNILYYDNKLQVQ
ncbi:hypothetical protein Hanom_Chr17g01553331 [Helianthus anomalus]